MHLFNINNTSRSIRAVFIFAFAVVFIACGSAYALTADPMDISVGARGMGMGDAYVGVAENAETIFVNPAGLGDISSLKLTSMYTSLFDEVNYTVISGAYPISDDLGTIGAGVISQATGNIPLYDNLGTFKGNGSYGENVLFVSQGVNLGKTLIPSAKDVYGGYTVKYVSNSASGKGTTDLSGSGFSADLGLLYKPKGYMSYGLSLQNILAGTMDYANGENDTIDSAMKLGAKASLMGDASDGGALYQSDANLDLAMDVDMGIRGEVPGTLHAGVEYQPQLGANINKMLTLRAGVNQIPAPNGNISNLTLGLGFDYQGFEFNYAYSPIYADIPNTSSQFFSISYVGVPMAMKPVEEKPIAVKPVVAPVAVAPVVEQGPMISQLTPEDKAFTTSSVIPITGKVSNPARIAKLQINTADVKIADDGTFAMNVPVSTTGKHLETVIATDINGKTEEHLVRVVRLTKFADVPEGYWAVAPIEKLATKGLIEGYPSGAFMPDRALSRAELAALLVKSKGIEPPPSVSTNVFSDIAPSHWAARYVKEALNMGLVRGYPDGTYRPNNRITRAEGVAVMARFGELPMQASLNTPSYPDLTASYWGTPFIESAKTAGMLDYIDGHNFEPRRELTRAEAVSMLSKTQYAKASADTLTDWTVGFAPEITAPLVAENVIQNSEPSSGTAGMPVAGGGDIVPAPGKQVQLKGYADVGNGSFAKDSIKYLATAGVMTGYPDGTFKPGRVVTRAELAALLVKAKSLPASSTYNGGFSDVPKDFWAAQYIKASVDAGYLSGRAARKFEPNKAATRAEAVAALIKFDNAQIPLNLVEGPFPDMTAKEWSSRYVAAAKDSGMLGYLQGQNFEAKRPVTRAELAELLANTKFGQAKVQQMKAASAFQ